MALIGILIVDLVSDPMISSLWKIDLSGGGVIGRETSFNEIDEDWGLISTFMGKEKRAQMRPLLRFIMLRSILRNPQSEGNCR